MVSSRYTATARALHWLIALLVAVQFVIAWRMPDVHKDTRPVGLLAWHLGVGTVILLGMLGRWAWRATHAVPPPPQALPPMLQRAARVTHFLLYALLVLVPLLGWANASSRGWAVRLAGVLPLPPLAAEGSALGHQAGDVHTVLAYVLLALIGAHIAGALFHRFVLKDDTLQRMLPP